MRMSPSALKLRMTTAMSFGIVNEKIKKSLSGMVKDTQEGMKSVSVTAGSMVQKSKENMKKTFTFIQQERREENTNTIQPEHTNTQHSQQQENDSSSPEDMTERDDRQARRERRE